MPVVTQQLKTAVSGGVKATPGPGAAAPGSGPAPNPVAWHKGGEEVLAGHKNGGRQTT